MTRSIERNLAQSVWYAAQAQHAWFETSDEFKQLADKFQALNESVSLSMSLESISVYVTGDKALLATCIKFLRAAGYVTSAEPPKPNQPQWTPTYRREDQNSDEFWTKTAAEREESMSQYPTVNLYFSSSVCKVVQVGTEMKEVPIFDVRCGDQTVEEPTASSAVGSGAEIKSLETLAEPESTEAVAVNNDESVSPLEPSSEMLPNEHAALEKRLEDEIPF